METPGPLELVYPEGPTLFSNSPVMRSGNWGWKGAVGARMNLYSCVQIELWGFRFPLMPVSLPLQRVDFAGVGTVCH